MLSFDLSFSFLFSHSQMVVGSETRLGNLLDFGQLFKAWGLPKFLTVSGNFCKSCQNL